MIPLPQLEFQCLSLCRGYRGFPMFERGWGFLMFADCQHKAYTACAGCFNTRLRHASTQRGLLLRGQAGAGGLFAS